jgi:cytochrome oxidase assembly protein ShyY1
MKTILAFLLAITVIIILAFGGWKLERWANWKLSYGGKVDAQITQLKKRIEVLEKASNK